MKKDKKIDKKMLEKILNLKIEVEKPTLTAIPPKKEDDK